MRTRKYSLGGTVLVGILLAAGCGDDSTSNEVVGTPSALDTPTAVAVVDSAEENTKLDDAALKAKVQAAGIGISTVRGVGDVRSPDGDTPVGFDFRYDHRRRNFIGTMTYGAHRLELRRVGPDLYLKAAGDYWTASGKLADPNTATSLHDKYVRIEADNPRFEDVTEIAEYGNVATVVSDWRSAARRRSEETVGGTRTIVLALRGGPQLYVPATGNPVPIRLTIPGEGAVAWSELGTPVDVVAPPAADTVDLPALAVGVTKHTS